MARSGRAQVAKASRILVEGVHDAELVEKVWGDDLRIEGVVVEYLGGIDDLAIVVCRTTYLTPPMVYRNLFVIRFADDGRCTDFTEWYIEEQQG